MLKMSTVRYAYILAIFAIFCVNILTKSDKRFIIDLQVNIGIFRNTALRCGAKYRETGCESPTQKRHCKVCMFFPTAQQRGHSREWGRLCGKNGRKSTHQVRIFGSISNWHSQAERYAVHKNVCTKAKGFGAFLF